MLAACGFTFLNQSVYLCDGNKSTLNVGVVLVLSGFRISFCRSNFSRDERKIGDLSLFWFEKNPPTFLFDYKLWTFVNGPLFGPLAMNLIKINCNTEKKVCFIILKFCE